MATEVLAVRYGTLATNKSALFYRYGAYRDPDAARQMDYFFLDRAGWRRDDPRRHGFRW